MFQMGASENRRSVVLGQPFFFLSALLALHFLSLPAQFQAERLFHQTIDFFNHLLLATVVEGSRLLVQKDENSGCHCYCCTATFPNLSHQAKTRPKSLRHESFPGSRFRATGMASSVSSSAAYGVKLATPRPLAGAWQDGARSLHCRLKSPLSVPGQ